MSDPQLWIAFISLVLGFGFVIFVHELGHFLVAKGVGIKCTQFAIGFGQALICYRTGMGYRRGTTEPEYDKRILDFLEAEGIEPMRRPPEGEPLSPNDFAYQHVDRANEELGLGETEYRLNWMPLGGYVKMVGQEDMDPTARSNDPRSFNNKSVGARMAVISAGVVMNLIFGIIFFVIAFMAGVAFPPPIIGGVAANGPASKVFPVEHPDDEAYRGLKAGDRGTHVNDEPIRDFMAIKMAAGLSNHDESIKITVNRGDETLNYIIPPEKNDAMEGIRWVGLAPAQSLTVGRLRGGSILPPAFREAGVQPGMKAVSVNGKPIKYYHELKAAIDEADGGPVEVLFRPATSKAGADADKNDAKAVKVTYEASPYSMGSTDALLLGLQPTVRFLHVVPGTPAEASGAKDGDLLAQLGAEHWPHFQAMKDEADKQKGKAISFVVDREGKEVTSESGLTPSAKGTLGVIASPAYFTDRVAGADPKSLLAKHGVAPGSRVLAINGKKVDTLAEMQRVLVQIARKAIKKPQPVAKAKDAPKPVATNGPTSDAATDKPQATPEGKPGEEATDKPVEKPTPRPEGQTAIEAAPDPAVADVVAKADAKDVVATVELKMWVNLAGGAEETYQIPLSRALAEQIVATPWADPNMTAFKMLEEPVVAGGAWEATKMGVEKTQMFMIQTYITLKRLVYDRTIGLNNLRGPVGIAHVGTQIAYEKGWTYLLFFLGLISVNLVVINFLPIPIVDGGHMVFLMVEKIKGSPVSVRFQTAATIVGLALIACVFLTTLFYDVSRLAEIFG